MGNDNAHLLVAVRAADGGGAIKRDMFVPTLHLASCGAASRSNSALRPLTVEEAWPILLSGAKPVQKAKGGWVSIGTAPTLPSRVCSRCRVTDVLTAHDPEGFAAWQRESASIQPSLPTMRQLVQRLKRTGLPWRSSDEEEGFGLLYPDRHRQSGALADYEVLMGWMGPSGHVSVSPGIRLDQLFAALPPHGFAVRRMVDSPERLLAVRLMTPWEVINYQAPEGERRQAPRNARSGFRNFV